MDGAIVEDDLTEQIVAWQRLALDQDRQIQAKQQAVGLLKQTLIDLEENASLPSKILLQMGGMLLEVENTPQKRGQIWRLFEGRIERGKDEIAILEGKQRTTLQMIREGLAKREAGGATRANPQS